MKRNLLALTILSAFAATAAAQSSVTLFGVVDLGVSNIKNGSAGTIQGLTPGAAATSRLGFRGIEDLGGGLKAGFHLEAGTQPDVGTVSASKFWDRRSTVSLYGSWGEIRLGHDYNPSSRNTYIFEPYVGTSVGSILNFTLAVPTAGLGSGATTLLRSDNTVAYYTPAGLGGFYGEAMVGAGEGVPGVKYVGGRVGYKAGQFDVSAGYGKTEAAGGDDFKQANVAGQWDFGVAKLQGLYNTHSFGPLKQKTWSIGVKAPMGSGELLALYGANDRSGGPVGSGFGDADDSKLMSVGYYHFLSKRTNLYGIAGRVTNDGAAKLSVGLTTPAAMLPGETSTGIQFGITHRF
ncbi:Outer membrane porin protein 32 [Burkholderiaceae bacterium]|nr:Outer membrane porin protein 32 [Burkholderiaceae bacterium]